MSGRLDHHPHYRPPGPLFRSDPAWPAVREALAQLYALHCGYLPHHAEEDVAPLLGLAPGSVRKRWGQELRIESEIWWWWSLGPRQLDLAAGQRGLLEFYVALRAIESPMPPMSIVVGHVGSMSPRNPAAAAVLRSATPGLYCTRCPPAERSETGLATWTSVARPEGDLSLAGALSPNERVGMSGLLAAILAFMLDEHWATPEINDLWIAADGCVVADGVGVAPAAHLDAALDHVAAAAKLNADLRNELARLYHARISDARSSA